MAFFKAFLLCMLISSTAFGQIYKFVDEHGNITYSDTPPADKQDMEPAELPEVFYQPGVEVPDLPKPSKAKPRAINVTINSPKEGATILGSATSMNVSASTSEKLIDGEAARLIVNGSPHSTGKALNWSVTDLIRGEYHLSVEIIDKSQKIIAQSAPVKVFVKRNIAR